MWRKVPFVILLSLLLSVPCWGQEPLSISSSLPPETSEPLSQPQSMLWRIADESLTVIEQSLIAQRQPVENLSIGLPELYQKSLELAQSVNALSLRFESFERYLTSFEKNMTQGIKVARLSVVELTIWRTVAIMSLAGSLTCIIFFTIVH